MSEYLITISTGNSNKSISLERFEGRFFVASTWENRAGETKANWCFRQDRINGENVAGKPMPIRIELPPDYRGAAATLHQLAQAIEDLGTKGGKPAQPPAPKEKMPWD